MLCRPVRFALLQRVDLIPAYPGNGLLVLTAKVPVEYKRNFPNERTNQKFHSKSKCSLILQTASYCDTHDLISNVFNRTQSNFGPVNDHMIKEISWIITMVTGHQ